MASSVLPVPALPTRVTSWTSSLSRRSSAKDCSLLRGRMPQTPSFGVLMSWTKACLAALYLPDRACAAGSSGRAGPRTRWAAAARPRRPSSGIDAARVEVVHLLRRRRRARTTPLQSSSRCEPLDVVVLGVEPERVGADAEVRVLRDEDGRGRLLALRGRRARPRGSCRRRCAPSPAPCGSFRSWSRTRMLPLVRRDGHALARACPGRGTRRGSGATCRALRPSVDRSRLKLSISSMT